MLREVQRIVRNLMLAPILLCGCGSYFTGVGHDAASGALGVVTSDDAKKRLSNLASEATKAARDEALGPDTDAKLQALIKNLGLTTRTELDSLITASFREQIRLLIRMAIDEALNQQSLQRLGTFREELVGTPLQMDIDALIDSATPHLTQAVQSALQTAVQQTIQTSVVPLENTADKEAAKWKPIIIAFAISSFFLVVCLIFSAHTIMSHRKVIESLLKDRKPEKIS
jgi:hypothetical protein